MVKPPAIYRLSPIYHFWHFWCDFCNFCVFFSFICIFWVHFFCIFCVFNNEDFWCAFFFDFLWFFFIFCVHFLHFLLPPIVKVDISDIALISVIPDMVKAIISGITMHHIGDNQYSSKNLSYCPINRFLESVTSLSHNHYFHLGVVYRTNRVGCTQVDTRHLGGTRIVMTACGWSHSMVVSAEGRVWTFLWRILLPGPQRRARQAGAITAGFSITVWKNSVPQWGAESSLAGQWLPAAVWD
jgi:hypothetical protein